ncbi:NmrA family NAD(P)-binding protein [Roseobacter weihaiensis]|uniref:NmrA family NAD(P)-binding protein n=1 Tax=Roseobacter weihaiensis TaxID=2763262 RepID=UPI001D0B93DE|nr:NAD(P)H-binding protein [Roseobacter sp. H9]
MTKTVLITGATGKIGAPTVDRLLDLGHVVRALVHTEASANRLTARGVNARVVDMDHPIDPTLFAYVDAALLITPVREHFRDISIRLIDAAKIANVGRVVRISIDSAFIKASAILGNGHAAADAHLVRSGLRHTILRPGGFMQNLLTMAPTIKQGEIVAPTGDGAVPFIDARDIADCAVAVLTDRTEIDGPVDISGPEPLTFAEIARRLTARLDHEVRHVSPVAEKARDELEAAGFDGWMLDAMMDDTAHVAAGIGADVNDGVKRLTGHEPRSIDAFLDENIEAFRA